MEKRPLRFSCGHIIDVPANIYDLVSKRADKPCLACQEKENDDKYQKIVSQLRENLSFAPSTEEVEEAKKILEKLVTKITIGSWIDSDYPKKNTINLRVRTGLTENRGEKENIVIINKEISLPENIGFLADADAYIVNKIKKMFNITLEEQDLMFFRGQVVVLEKYGVKVFVVRKSIFL